VKAKALLKPTLMCFVSVVSLFTIHQVNTHSPSDQAIAGQNVKMIDALAENETPPVEVPKWLQIDGLVQNVLNFTYAELSSFPMVSEPTTLYCVGPWLNVTYNWTGVPLFYLMSLAKVVPGGYREVVFNSTDNFSQSLPLEVIMEPTSILALKANGTDLEQVGGFGGGYRVVFPCRWGYKWVKWVQYITVIDHVYRGADLASTSPRVNCTMPETEPQANVFNVTKSDTGYSVLAMSSCAVQSIGYFWETRMIFNLTGHGGDTGYFYVSFSRGLMSGPLAVYVNQNRVDHSEIYAGDNAYVFFAFAQSAGNLQIEIRQLLAVESGSAWGESVKPLKSDE
jgi:DMSO/TMAO reductase YedYZ molybdopterin-dependent catalytic subunit